eukprot:6187817-Pleurochrysis_carterae.AAC.3
MDMPFTNWYRTLRRSVNHATWRSCAGTIGRWSRCRRYLAAIHSRHCLAASRRTAVRRRVRRVDALRRDVQHGAAWKALPLVIVQRTITNVLRDLHLLRPSRPRRQAATFMRCARDEYVPTAPHVLNAAASHPPASTCAWARRQWRRRWRLVVCRGVLPQQHAAAPVCAPSHLTRGLQCRFETEVLGPTCFTRSHLLTD